MARKRNTKTASAVTIEPIEPAAVAVIEPVTIEPIVPAAVEPAAMASPLSIAAAGGVVPDGYVVPAYIGAFVAGFRAMAGMPSVTRDERAACANSFAAAVETAMPGTAAPSGRHTGRFTGMPVFESQNTLYVAAVMANVIVTGGHVMAAWRVELPNAKCDYLAKSYAWSTLAEYVNGRHNGTTIPDGVNIVIAWNKRGRTPLTA